MNFFYIFIISNYFILIIAEKITPCLPAQECQYSGTTISCSEHGICFYDLFKFVSEDSSNKKFIDCICDEGYISQSEDDEIKCCYMQKLQKYAMLFELLPFGIGHYYTGRYINFAIKLAFEIIFILCIIIFGLCCQTISRKKKFDGYEVLSNGKQNKNDFLLENPNKIQITTNQLISNAVFLVSFFSFVIWQAFDLFFFGLNLYTDGNNIDLKRW